MKYGRLAYIGDKIDSPPAAYGSLSGEAKVPNACDHAGWTDDRVERLKKLWAKGLSGAQIAKQLGGVTRNAVIGKVHRLGLSATGGFRATASSPRPVAAATPKPAQPRRTLARIAMAPAVQSVAPAHVKPLEPVALRDETPGLVTPLTLGAHMCKWPIGDPRDADFTHCGKRASDGPYCATHAQVAYQPQKPKANELARSLRRYV